MKIVKFKAGLGNQMFQYGFLRYLQEIYHINPIKIDITYYDNEKYRKYWNSGIIQFDLSVNEAAIDEVKKYKPLAWNRTPGTTVYRMLTKLEYTINHRCYFEKNRAYVDIAKYLSCEYFDGYWQSWKYLEPIRPVLLKEFQPRRPLSEKTRHFMNQICNKNSVFVGARRGDYLNNKYAQNHYGACSLEYYAAAIQYMCGKVSDPMFVFFSNDIEWVQKNLNADTLNIQPEQIIYRMNQDVCSDFEELFVMSACKNAVISNSTFNFWGAWLIQDDEKIVIAPKQWFKDGSPIDIIPNSWIKM